jgi:hypothetical protein
VAPIDPATGICTSVGNTGEHIASISFRANGTLYGAVGNDALVLPANSLCTISLVDATPTSVVALNGIGGQSIAFNLDDGLLYHTGGRLSTTRVFESVDVDSLAITPIPLSGHSWQGCMGLTYGGTNTLLSIDGFADQLVTITTSGAATAGPFLAGIQGNSIEFTPIYPVELMRLSVE